jgi:hypothetical protein
MTDLNLTQTFIACCIEGHRLLDSRIREIAVIVTGIRQALIKPEQFSESFRDWKIDGDTVTVQFEEMLCGCCGPEYSSVTYPVSFLWTPQYTEIEQQSWNDKLEAEAKAKALEQVATKTKAEQREREMYERLRQKFESGSTTPE